MVRHGCMPAEALERYVTGSASEGERVAVEGHAGACADCREALLALGLALGRGTREEEALIAWINGSRPIEQLLGRIGVVGAPEVTPTPLALPMPRTARARPARSAARSAARWAVRRWKTVAGAVAAAACVVLAFALPQAPPDLPFRSLNGRPAALRNHVPYAGTRGPADPAWREIAPDDMRALGPGGERALLLARGGVGDWERVAAMLAMERPSARVANDRGVLLLAQGDALGALHAFEEALRMDPGLHAARFNRALALGALGDWAEADDAWRDYLAHSEGDDEGWREEAKAHLAR